MKWKAWLLSSSLLVTPAWAAIPGNTLVVSTVAVLKALPVGTGLGSPNVRVLGYYSTTMNCPIDYKWSPTSALADDKGAILNPDLNPGNGRWLLNQPTHSPLHTCVYGLLADGTSNNYTRLQAALNWAHTYGANWVHIDGTPGGTSGPTNCTAAIVFGTSLEVPEGEIVEGDGNGTLASGQSGNTCLYFNNTVGWGLESLSVQSGIGLTPFESPKFRDFTINAPSSTSTGGCIRLNSISGGFTDDNSSQQAIIHPEIRNMTCYMGFITNNGQLGFQINKGADGTIFHSDSYNGLTGIDLEGSDDITIDGGCRVTNTYGAAVRFATQGTFGNNDTIQNCQLLTIADTGAMNTVNSQLFDNARSSTISNVFFEGQAPAGGALLSTIHLSGGLTAGVHDNNLTTTATNTLLVDGVYNNITVVNNGTAGGTLTQSRFNNGNYFFNGSGLQQTLVHYGNGQNVDSGWPFNSKIALEVLTFPKVDLVWTPSLPGMQYLSIGTTEVPVNNLFTFSATGTSNYLDFRHSNSYNVMGTFDLSIHAWESSGTGQITCQLTDNGATVGSTVSQNITASPTWYTLAFNQAIATDAGVRCASTGNTSALLGQINLIEH